jgi:hypothetical protein
MQLMNFEAYDSPTLFFADHGAFADSSFLVGCSVGTDWACCTIA